MKSRITTLEYLRFYNYQLMNKLGYLNSYEYLIHTLSVSRTRDETL